MLNRTALSAPVRSIVSELESDIIFGRLRPNQEIIEDALMQTFSAKRHEVRSAIQELVVMGLVVKPRSKSARVKDFMPSEVQEIYHMRALLQRDAAHIMPFPADSKQLKALKEIHVKYATAVAINADKYLIHTLNDSFHEQLFSLCGNKELCKAIRMYAELSNPIRSYGIADTEWLKRATQEHQEMIKAIEAQDRATLERLVVEHMQPTRNRWEELQFISREQPQKTDVRT